MSLALYRTYRPGRLADVIGQDHVTVPLGRALDSDRVHHAYLFTGPRGCGKTSTARILARSLNCVEGPTSEPCGQCQSCQDLSPGGPGSIDVVEMDAATNRGIDDARELREKAMYAPAASRYKVFIIDEAHQLTKEAWNALLKLIEEPPPHLRFVFATTEPDAVLPTIRSRTHQYPFRLVTSRRLQEHLAWTCEQEQTAADPAALALVARAAQGSVRDGLSILGQLIAGSGEEGVTYADALAQLGFTDDALLERLVDALVEGDGKATFTVVDEVIESGTDPRRFATDLLERLRDLLVLRQVPDAVETGLLDLPDGVLDVLRRQSQALGDAQLSRAADLVSAGLSQLKGSTAPRLQLELLSARLLLPAADDSGAGLLARLERLEHRVALGAPPATPTDGAAPERPAARPTPDVEPAPPARPARPSPAAPAAESPARPAGSAPKAPPRLSTLGARRADSPAQDHPTPDPGAAGSAAPRTGQGVAQATDPGDRPTPAIPPLADVRTAWPAVLAAVASRSRVAATLVDGTTPVSVDDLTLVLAHPEAARYDFLRASASHLGALTAAVREVLGVGLAVDLVLGGAGPAAAPATPATTTTAGDAERSTAPATAPAVDPESEIAADDPDADTGDTSPLALLSQRLGGAVIDEFDHTDPSARTDGTR